MKLLGYVPQALPWCSVGRRMGEVRKQQLTKQCEGITIKLACEQLCYPFVSGGTPSYKEQPLLKSVGLYFSEIGEWKLLLVPYTCKKVLNILTSKAEKFAYSYYH